MAAHSRPSWMALRPLDSTNVFVGIFAYQQFLDIRAGHQMHHLGAFATIRCKCKSKSNILTNVPLRNSAVRKIEESGFGVQAICSKAPSLGLALVGRYEFNVEGQFIQYVVPQGLDNYNAGPFRKLLDRLKSFSRPTLSITARCTGFNTFVLSVMPYTISYFGLTTLDLNRLRQAAAKFILKRHWLEAEILPYVLRYFGIATLLDPEDSRSSAKIRRLRLIVIDLDRSRNVGKRVYWQFHEAHLSATLDECFNTLAVPTIDPECPYRCRYVYGYGIDGSDQPQRA